MEGDSLLEGVGDTLVVDDALTEIVILLVEDALLDGVILRVGETLAVEDTLSGGVILLERVSLTERVADGDMDTDSSILLLAVVVLLIEGVGESDNVGVREGLNVLVGVREGLNVLVLVRLRVGVRVGLGDVEGGMPIVPAKL
jgi:hypothetical protein